MTRYEPDSCPGVLQVHAAADGPLVRVRLPGGALTSEQLSVLATAAAELGNGRLDLTARANVQLRAVRNPDNLADRLRCVGLLPSARHERVRNILASPLSGIVGGLSDIRPLVAALDEGLQGSPALAQLPGRILFTLDDGRGDVSGLDGDIGAHAVSSDTFALTLAGADSGIRLPRDTVVEAVLAAAHRFQDIRGSQWRLREVPEGPSRVAADLPGARTVPQQLTADAPPPIGWLPHGNDHVTLGLGVRFGSLSTDAAKTFAALGVPIIVTPWRGVVLAGLEQVIAGQVLAHLDTTPELIVDPQSPWLLVTACIGQPGCACALADVRADATAAVIADPAAITRRQHWSGCHRRCGRPPGTVTDIVATDNHCYRT